MNRVVLGELTAQESQATETTVVHCGSWVKPVACRRDTVGGTVHLPGAALAALGLQPGKSVHLFTTEQEHHMYVGPLVGVMLADITGLLQGPTGDRYRSMIAAGESVGVCPFLFEAAGVDLGAAKVSGWVIREGNWVQLDLPLPDVVYNRATHDNAALRERARHLCRQFRSRLGIAQVNAVHACSKLEFYEALRFFSTTADLVPETLPFTDGQALISLLARYPRVFVKANYGSHGTDVLQVKALEPGYAVTGQFDGCPVGESFARPEQVARFMCLLKGEGEWVLQQGIELPKVEGRIFDLRAILQKDGQGEWTIPIVLVRWAQPEKVAANMSQGGEPFLPSAFLERFGASLPAHRQMAEVAVEAALKAAVSLEARFGTMGEIGLDVGVDVDGRAWLFEANTKPVHPQVPGFEGSLLVHPFEYALELASRAWAGHHAGLNWCHPLH